MNVPKAIELAFAKVIRNYAEMGAGVVLRPWQSLNYDGSWDEEKDRTFPLIDIRCGPGQTDDNQRTLFAECSIICATDNDDDKGHTFISDMYEAVQTVLDGMFSQFIAGTQSTSVLAEFLAEIQTVTGTGFIFGGLEFESPLPPADDAGSNVIGITMKVSYSRSDY